MIRSLEAVLGVLICGAILLPAASTQLAGEIDRRDDQGQVWLRLNLNRAEAADLMALPGMTYRKAHALVSVRSKRGQFKALEELSAIPGFTRNYVYRIQDLIDVH